MTDAEQDAHEQGEDAERWTEGTRMTNISRHGKPVDPASRWDTVNPGAPTPIYPNGECPHCGGPLFGDCVRTVLHCENAPYDRVVETEPDANPVLCEDEPPQLIALLRDAAGKPV